MKNGRVSETVLKRSVINQIKTKRSEVVSGAGIGENCAIFSFQEQRNPAVSASSFCIAEPEEIAYPIREAVNALAAGGAEPVAVTVTIMLSEEADEPALRAMMQAAERTCASLSVEIAGVSAAGCSGSDKTVVSVFASGAAAPHPFSGQVVPGQDIVISKWIGLEGSARLALAKKPELALRYPARLIEEAGNFVRYLSVVPEAATAIRSGICAMHNAAECGIFGALWELAEGAGVGLEIDLKKIPIRQETIEICEFFEISPYELHAGGCLLMVTENGFDLARALEKEGIPAVAAGKIMAGKDRVVMNEEERRFLEPPKSDEIHKIL